MCEPSEPFTGISLFSGAGGDTLGMSNSNVNVIGYSELVPRFCETHNAPENRKYLNCDCLLIGHDVREITNEVFTSYKGKVDIIFSGFCCQGYSRAGKRDPNDLRNQLYKEFVRATKHIQPKFIIGENVKGLLTSKIPNGKLLLDVIEQEFRDLGYTIKHKILTGVDYGVPQKRDRLFIIGRNDNVEPNFPVPITKNVTLGLQNIVKFNMIGAMKIPKHIFDFNTIPDECILTDDTDDSQEVHKDVHPYLRLKATTINAVYSGKTHSSLISFAKRDSPIHCEVIDIRKPSKTIICTYGHQPRLFVPLKNKNGYYLRCLLVDELKQIQGFPFDYIIKGSIKEQIIQVGNAIPTSMAEAVVNSLTK